MSVEVGSVVAWTHKGAWTFGVTVAADEVRAVLKPVYGSPSNRVTRPVATLTPVLTASVFVSGLHNALTRALQASDGAGPVAVTGGRR